MKYEVKLVEETKQGWKDWLASVFLMAGVIATGIFGFWYASALFLIFVAFNVAGEFKLVITKTK